MGTCRPMGSRSRQGMMVVALTLFVAACGAGDDQEQQPLEVRVLYAPSGKGDRAWNDRAWRGVLEGRDLTGARIEEGMPDSDDAAVSIFHRWVYGAAPEQNELIITLSGTYTDMVREAGCPPDGRWLLHVEGDLPECDRLRSVQYSSFEPAFLAGVAAASISKTGRRRWWRGFGPAWTMAAVRPRSST